MRLKLVGTAEWLRRMSTSVRCSKMGVAMPAQGVGLGLGLGLGLGFGFGLGVRGSWPSTVRAACLGLG